MQSERKQSNRSQHTRMNNVPLLSQENRNGRHREVIRAHIGFYSLKNQIRAPMKNAILPIWVQSRHSLSINGFVFARLFVFFASGFCRPMRATNAGPVVRGESNSSSLRHLPQQNSRNAVEVRSVELLNNRVNVNRSAIQFARLKFN